MAAFSSFPNQTIQTLSKYTACDISDALLELKVPGAGFIPDLNLYASGLAGGYEGYMDDNSKNSNNNKNNNNVTVAPASTVLFAPKGMLTESSPSLSSLASCDYPQPNIPIGTHWVDLTQPGTIVVIQQPAGQKNAVCGGIMALRITQCHAKGIIICGRARDVAELRSTGLPIWASGLSTIGSGASCAPWAVQTPITVDGGVVVMPGDLVFSDPINGVVVIPKAKVTQVIELLPRLTGADDKVKSDVLKGMSVKEAFELHRGNL